MNFRDIYFAIEVSKLYKLAMDNGGFTVQFDGKRFNHYSKARGYSVSLPEFEVRATELASAYIFAGIIKGLEEARQEQEDPASYWVGGWKDGDMLYFDISAIYSNRQEAISAAKTGGQLAIFNFKTMQVERI